MKSRQFEEKFSKDLYNTIFKYSPLGIFHFDLSGEIFQCNEQFTKIMGSSKKRLIGLNMLQNLPDDRIRDAVSKALESGYGSMRGEYTSYTGRTTSYVSALFFGLHDETGEITTGIGIVEDLTAMHKIQMQYNASNALFKSLMYSLPDPLWAKDLKGRFMALNQRFEALCGYDESELIGKSDYDVFSKELADFFRTNDKKALESDSLNINEEELTFADGHTEICETVKAPIYNINGEATGVLGIARDITARKSLEKQLSLTQFSIDNANMAIYWIDAQSGKIFYVNYAACNSLGYDFEELVSLSVIDIDADLDKEGWDEHKEVLFEHKEAHFERRHIRKDGSTFPVEIIAKILNYQGRVYNIAFAIDISERKGAQESLQKSEKLLRESQRIGKIGSWEYSFLDGSLVWSDEVYKIFHIDKMSPPHYENIHPKDKKRVQKAFKDAIENHDEYNVIYRLLIGEDIYYVHERAQIEFDKNEKPIRSIGTALDITDERGLEKKVEYASNYDQLTKLPNKKFFMEKLTMLLERNPQKSLSLCFVDLDNFKYINDAYGHTIGDEILKESAKRLEDKLNHYGWIARFGSDEFVLVLDKVAKFSDLLVLVEEFRLLMNQAFIIHGVAHKISISMGLSLYPDDATSPEELVMFADMAMHKAKEFGKNRYAFYTDALTKEITRKMQIMTQLQEAIHKEEFELYYQPQYDVVSEEIIGFEALVRWHHPSLGFISPAEFIPLAEESKLIIPLGSWILQQSCRQLKLWQEAGLFDGKIAVNVSGVQLGESDFPQELKATLSKTKLDAKSVEIELTESTLMSNADLYLQELQSLASIGVSLAIDDFGTGYSSLSHLRKMPFSLLKIDQSFIRDLPEDSDACVVVESIIGLARNMKMQVLAEGVETKEELDFLSKSLCTKVQGYYFQKPLKAENALKLLQIS